MIHVVTAVGILICAAALVGLAAPSTVINVASRVVSSKPLRGTAIAARVVFGAIAILAADQTPYPLAMKIIGVLAIMAGTAVAFVNEHSLNRWIEGIRQSGARARAMFLAALGFGAFLVHAAW